MKCQYLKGPWALLGLYFIHILNLCLLWRTLKTPSVGFDATLPCPWQVHREASPNIVLFFSLYFPMIFKHKIMLLGWLLNFPKKPTHSGPLWIPEILFCSTQEWEYCSTKGLCSRPPPGSSARILSQIYSFLTLKTFSPDSPLQTKVRFPACSSSK